MPSAIPAPLEPSMASFTRRMKLAGARLDSRRAVVEEQLDQTDLEVKEIRKSRVVQMAREEDLDEDEE